MARVEDSMKKEHATLTPASKSLLEFRIRVDAHHIVVEENGTFSVGQVFGVLGGARAEYAILAQALAPP